MALRDLKLLLNNHLLIITILLHFWKYASKLSQRKGWACVKQPVKWLYLQDRQTSRKVVSHKLEKDNFAKTKTLQAFLVRPPPPNVLI